MNNIFISIKSRFLNFKRFHFNWFPEGRTIIRLKNLHQDKRCFIIGNGPSLRAEDLTRIHNAGDISFACNRIFHIFPETPWRPTYYISQDPPILSSCVNEVSRIEAKNKFIPIELKWYNDIDVKDATYFHIETTDGEDPSKVRFSEDISKYISNSRTVVYTAIQIAVYMGIKEIYFIGVDHHFHTSRNAKGEVIVDPTAKDYFSSAYNQDKEKLVIPCTDESTMTFIAAKNYAESHGIKIYNATRGGKLEVFERKDFDSLF